MSRQQAPPPPAEPGPLDTPDLPARRLAALEARLSDLAREQRRQGEQIAALADLVEAGGGDDRPAPAPALGRRPGPSLAKSLLRRLLRSTIGVARRLWRASAAPPEPPLRIELDPRPARRLPSLAVVFPSAAGTAGDEDSDPLAAAVRRQSEAPAERIFWSPPAYAVESAGGERRRGEAAGVEELRRASSADYFLTAGEALARLPATAFELARLACAAEDLAWLEIPAAGGGPAVLVRRELWGPAARSGVGRRARPAVGKTLDGGYRIAPRPALRPHLHRLRPLDGLEPGRPVDGGPASGEPAVLLLLSSSLAGGRDRLAADLVRSHGGRFRFLVATLAASGELQRERLRQLERLAPAVYPLADFLAAEIVPSALGLLVRRHRVAAVLHLGGELPAAIARALEEAAPELAVVDRPRFGDDGGGPQLCGVSLPPPAGDRQKLRRELGVAGDAVVVTMAGDLLIRRRPEDFVALAHRLRGDRRFFFLLVGRGPLAGTVDDLERYLAPGNFRRLRSAPLGDLLAATDVACTTAEEEPLPYFPLAALAAGLPAVAAAVDGLGELLAEAGAAVPAGDLPAFEAAIRGLADAGERRERGERGRHLVERAFRLEDAMEKYRELLEQAML